MKSFIFATILLALVSRGAHAQTGGGAIVSGSVAAAVIEEGTKVSVEGSVGYRFNRVIGIGVELTSLPRLRLALPPIPASPYEAISYTDRSGDLLVFTSNVRVEIPTIWTRILPYAVGGGGVSSTRQDYTIRAHPVLPPLPVTGGAVLTIPDYSSTVHSTSTGMALTLGGGVSVLAAGHLSVDVDLRTLYIRGNPGGSIGRFGAGVSYRFE